MTTETDAGASAADLDEHQTYLDDSLAPSTVFGTWPHHSLAEKTIGKGCLACLGSTAVADVKKGTLSKCLTRCRTRRTRIAKLISALLRQMMLPLFAPPKLRSFEDVRN